MPVQNSHTHLGSWGLGKHPAWVSAKIRRSITEKFGNYSIRSLLCIRWGHTSEIGNAIGLSAADAPKQHMTACVRSEGTRKPAKMLMAVPRRLIGVVSQHARAVCISPDLTALPDAAGASCFDPIEELVEVC